ncbi:MAG: FHA domain-containing protein, partial [Lachnospiraceae bacterium]|nr:FHA domain-containing protein [Lachnospiraceae bacterium]
TAYAYGFPGIAENDDKDAVSQRSISDVSVTSGLISRLLTQHGTGVREIQTDTEFWHGNSGGPLVLENGIAIGITANYYMEVKGVEREEMNYAVSMAEVIPLLKNNNISYTSEPVTDENDTKTGDETEIDGTEIAGTSEEATSSENGGESSEVASPETQKSSEAAVDTAEEEDSGLHLNMTMILIIVIAAVVIVLILVIVILNAKKKKASGGNYGGGSPVNMGNPIPMNGGNQMGNPAPVNAPNMGTMDFNLSVQGVSGLFAGRTYAQGRDGRVMFGRQPSCQVVFGGNDKNISGNHCVLFKQDGGVMLMDLGSTNGTYLENGTRLQPNVAYALHAGERFYLVNKNYMFMIK